MRQRVLLLTGPTCAGKSSIADRLGARADVRVIRVREILASLLDQCTPSRGELQELGRRLEASTDGAWLRDAVVESVDSSPRAALAVIDAARTIRQVEGIRQGYPGLAVVHVTASPQVRESRFKQAAPGTEVPLVESARFEDLLSDDIEQEAESLGSMADIVIDTTGCTRSAAAKRVLSFLRKDPP